MTGRHGAEPPRPDRRQERITIALALIMAVIVLAAAAAWYAHRGLIG